MDEIILTIEGKDFSFKRTITESRAAQVISLLSSASQTNILNTTTQRVQTVSSPSRRGGAREEVHALAISTSLEGYPDYHDLPTKADKIIWILQYAEHNNIKGLSSGDIDFLSSEMKDRIEAKNFGAFNNRNVKLSYVNKSGGLFHTQQKGLTHLKTLKNNHV